MQKNRDKAWKIYEGIKANELPTKLDIQRRRRTVFGCLAIRLFGVGKYLFWPKSDDHRGWEGKEREIMQSAREFGQGLLYFVFMCAAIRASC